jgi:hypothetical protein
VLGDEVAQQVAVDGGWRGMKGAPKQVEKVASGSLTPFSVPATFAV